MLRGSSFMLQKSSKYIQPVIEYIATLPKSYWDIDVDKYDGQNINIILNIYRTIKNLIIRNGNRDLTLISKILLGVFGFVPAFDGNFCAAFRCMANGMNGNPKCGFRSLNQKSLLIVKQFYDENSEIINKLSLNSYTIDFVTGTYTNINYTKAKIIDMFGFIYGQHV
jgi:hypothetical protein